MFDKSTEIRLGQCGLCELCGNSRSKESESELVWTRMQNKQLIISGQDKELCQIKNVTIMKVGGENGIGQD